MILICIFFDLSNSCCFFITTDISSHFYNGEEQHALIARISTQWDSNSASIKTVLMHHFQYQLSYKTIDFIKEFQVTPRKPLNNSDWSVLCLFLHTSDV